MEKETATVKDLIEHLESNFKEDDMLCFFNEGGAWCEVEHVPESFIGNLGWMFNYVKDKRKHELDGIDCNKDDAVHMRDVISDEYRLVEDDDVVIF